MKKVKPVRTAGEVFNLALAVENSPEYFKHFSAPNGTFDPAGDWVLSYEIYDLTFGKNFGGYHVGRVGLERAVQDDGSFVLRVDWQKIQPGGNRQVTTGEIHCQTDLLSTPVLWEFVTETFSDTDQKVLAGSRLERTARAAGNKIEFSVGRRKWTEPISGAYSERWTLFDAVQRLEHESVGDIVFTMIDHFNQAKGGHVLSYRQSVDIELGGQTVRFYTYDHVGSGIVPWMYWVDQQGRCVFAVSGAESYLMSLPSQ